MGERVDDVKNRKRRLEGLYCISCVYLCDGKVLLGVGHIASVLYHDRTILHHSTPARNG